MNKFKSNDKNDIVEKKYIFSERNSEKFGLLLTWENDEKIET